ncbi:Alg9-like mannosyltransferase [Linderina pennispora]|uniref:Mannosyltransferase n=1 Tax=Linderina pennispora TaxID=61395 RepID=A0A1Y1W2E8_9FUNG|nr:Alg9-like mannosyltransferase [Linderina pennispora]ORX67436.1 Alg9-like mannosyltransferase [Linderina pennispora]
MWRARSFYLALLVARVAFSVLPAYIHPDELFQAPEVAANDIFGLEAVRTWEFDPQAPIRSSVPIYIYAGFPMLLVKIAQRMLLALFGYRLELTSQLLFCAPRVFMALLSFLVDASIYDTLKRLNPTARMTPTMILVASSYCLAVFHTHTFSNSFASIVLALCFNLLARIEQACVPTASSSQAELATHGQLIKLSILFGVCVALGTFGHIAFAAFALPLCLVCAAILVNAVWTDTVGLRCALGAFSGVAVGGIGSLLAITLADSVYFGLLKVGATGVSGSLTCTLLNNLSYNTKKDNLAEHGIHPWYLHATTSMPTLFGPLYILAIAKLWAFAKSSAARAETSYTSAAAALSVVVGVGAMSMVPHQEPRFLLPAFTGMVLCTWRWHRLAPDYFWILWLVFNVLLSIGYGVVHQSGVVPMLDYLSRTSVARSAVCTMAARDSHGALCAASPAAAGDQRMTTRVLIFATYMAPRHLLVQPEQKDQWQARIELIDLVSVTDKQVPRYAA